VRPKKYNKPATIILVLIFAHIALANSVRDCLLQGNKLYDKEEFREALKKYDEALIDSPQSLEPKFNQANCYFRLDDLAQAIDLYNEVAADSKDMKLVAKARYNLGNCYFQRGSKQKDSNLQKALEEMQTSIVCWRNALEIDPGNERAAKNIEVARLTIKDIIDQINKQKQQQEQQAQKQKQLQDQIEELLAQQKSLAEKTQQTNTNAEEGKITQQQAEDNYKNQAQEQSRLKDETGQTLQQMQVQDPNSPFPPQMSQAGNELAQAIDGQAEAEIRLEAFQGQAAKESEDEAAEHLENALKALSQPNQPDQQQQQQEQQEKAQQSQQSEQSDEQEQQQKEQKATAASDTTAQEILDKEQREKKQRHVLQRGSYQKVEKDW